MRTLVLLDLANIGKTLRNQEMLFDPGKTLGRIREEHEIVAVWGFSDMVKQLSYRNNQLELQDLGVWLFHTPKENPWDKPDDDTLMTSVRWMLNICPDSFDAIHLGSGDGDFNEVMWEAYSGSGKTIFIDSSGLLPVSAGIKCYATSSDFLRAKPKNQKAVVTSDDMLNAIRARMANFRDHLERFPFTPTSPSIPFDAYTGSGYNVFEGEGQLVDCLLSETMRIILAKEFANGLCSFGYLVSIIRDQIQGIGCFSNSLEDYEAEIDFANAESWATTILDEAIKSGLMWKTPMQTEQGERLTMKANIDLYRSHFETPAEVVSHYYDEDMI